MKMYWWVTYKALPTDRCYSHTSEPPYNTPIMRPKYPKGSVSLFFMMGHTKAQPPGNKAFYTFSSVQAGWYLHDQAVPYVLHPISQKLPPEAVFETVPFLAWSTKALSYPFKSFASDKHKGCNSFYMKMLRKKAWSSLSLGFHLCKSCQNGEQITHVSDLHTSLARSMQCPNMIPFFMVFM